jgi:UDP-N-acetylglucosamine 1-carboxyvinyltransferase
LQKLRVTGGRRLQGTVRIGGAKNAALPALTASLLVGDRLELTNVPDVRDVRTMLRVLEQLGATVDTTDGVTALHFASLASFEAPYDLVKTMRASVMVLGPLVARHGRARVSLPGGCAIGERPINLHLDGLARMGADVRLEHGYVEAEAKRLKGTTLTFPIKTVTGTENLMMAATLAEGTTVLHNAALEPEVIFVADLLNAMGASIHGAGTDEIVIEGREALHGTRLAVIPDRIEAGTYLAAAAMAGDGIALEGVCPDHMTAVLEQFRLVNVPIETGETSLHVGTVQDLRSHDLTTAPHPGFPTDMQAQYMALATQARGTALIAETVFERRFMHVGELRRMGADIRIDGHTAVVVGPTPLTAAQVMATDLRASASLVLAGLVADGVTVVDRVYHLDRGYEPMEDKLVGLGASVERIR